MPKADVTNARVEEAPVDATTAIEDAPANAPPVPAPEKKTIEYWGEKKGHIMPGFDPENRYVSTSTHPLLGGRHRQFAPADFNVAKFRRDWPIGAEVTEAEYDAAIAEASSLTAQ